MLESYICVVLKGGNIPFRYNLLDHINSKTIVNIYLTFLNSQNPILHHLYGGKSCVLLHKEYRLLSDHTELQLKFNCCRIEFYICSIVGRKFCICQKWCDSHDRENIVHIEPITNSEENSDNEEGSSNGIDHVMDKLRYYTSAGNRDNIDTRHDFHDESFADGLFN